MPSSSQRSRRCQGMKPEMTQVSAVIGVMLLVGAGCGRSSHPTAKSNGLYERNTTSSAKQQGVLHFHATYTAPYCGGADPGDAVMARTRPWQGAVYVRHAVPDSSGKFAVNDPREPIMDTLRTDGTGNGSVVLPISNCSIRKGLRTRAAWRCCATTACQRCTRSRSTRIAWTIGCMARSAW